jgi:cytochrome bd-type quinol oxidase subunit 1
VAETWVRPPLLGREAPPAWLALWRFRLVMGVLLVVLVLLLLAAYRQITGASAQDPGVSDTPDLPAPTQVVKVPQLPLPGEP